MHAPVAGRAILRRILAPRADKRVERPPQLVHGLEEAPPPGQAAGLVAQQVAIQSIYLILPGIVAAQYGLAALDVVNFLCLSVAAIGLVALLQALPRGPVGSGYPIPSIPSPVFVAVYLLAAPGGNLAVAAALTAATGLVGIVLSLLLRRVQAILPTEVAGVVIFLIGISLLPRAFAATAGPALEAIGVPSDEGQGLLALGTLVLMILLALVGGRFARFAVLIGAAAGTVAALLGGIGLSSGVEVLSAAPWFALPQPQVPAAAAFDAGLLPAFCIALLASFASWTGDMVAFQRAADGGWRKADTPPLRRGLLAQSLGMALAGGIGAMAPATSSACVGLAIATRTLSRRIAVLGGGCLLALSCSPKLLALVVLLPEPVEAAMLGYVCCFMLASGCGLMTSRMLDTRRTFTVGLGIGAGIAALLGLPVFAEGALRMLGSPVTAGAAAAILLNLATAPLVARRAAFALDLRADVARAVDDQVEALGGAWGARRETMGRFAHALLELAELMAARGLDRLQVTARHSDDHVHLAIAWRGEPLPRPSARPDAADLDGPLAAREAFALWLATRQADSLEQRAAGGGCELRLVFAD